MGGDVPFPREDKGEAIHNTGFLPAAGREEEREGRTLSCEKKRNQEEAGRNCGVQMVLISKKKKRGSVPVRREKKGRSASQSRLKGNRGCNISFYCARKKEFISTSPGE